MLTEEFFVGGLKVQIHDNVLPDDALDNWTEFYRNKAQFSYNRVKQVGHEHDTYCLQCQLDFKTSANIFNLYDWLPTYLENFDSRCKMKHYHSSYINMLLDGDQFTSHADIHTLDSNEFYIGCIWFGNPVVPETNCGFKFDSRTVDYKFNRMLMFDGRIEHQPVSPSNDFLRLSYYISFSNAFKFKLSPIQGSNPWVRNILRNEHTQ